MESDLPSLTAVGAAAQRYFHRVFDMVPLILDDPWAEILLGPGAVSETLGRQAAFGTAFFRGLRSHILVRSRYAEDLLAAALGRGTGQVVVLGAGLDTYAWRQPARSRVPTIYEVDHPSTQQYKIRRLEAAGVGLPANLVFVPVNFENQKPLEALVSRGFDPDAPAYFSWLGVSMYLTKPAVDEVLAFVGSLAPGTELVLSFAQPAGGRGREVLEASVRSAGEPMISFFTPGEMEAKLRTSGFGEVTFPGPEVFKALYENRTDGLELPRKLGLVHGVVRRPRGPDQLDISSISPHLD